MSDFLSNFDNKNYRSRTEKKAEENSEKATSSQTDATSTPEIEKKTVAHKKQKPIPSRVDMKKAAANPTDMDPNENTQIDPTYAKRKRRKRILTAAISIILIALIWWIYYSMTHVKLPNFVDKNISEVRTWSNEQNVKLQVEQKYDTKTEPNIVLSQEQQADTNIKKGGNLIVTISIGPNPDEQLKLPNFSEMTKAEAQTWVDKEKAENITITDDFNKKIAKGKFIKQTFQSSDVTAENYKRKDQLVLYFSKGEEIFEKNIELPNFSKKTKDEVSEWGKTNDVKITFENGTADGAEIGTVISQNFSKGTKVAKKSTLVVTIATLKVPNFADYTIESAGEIEGITASVKKKFSESAPYGSLISQSLEAGTFITDKEGDTTVKVVYSAGRPYLKSYFGTLEGQLAEDFYNDYKANGANITYTTYSVDSDEEKGTVVKMSNYNTYVSMNYTVSLGISNGKGYTPSAQNTEKNTDTDTDAIDDDTPENDPKDTKTKDEKKDTATNVDAE